MLDTAIYFGIQVVFYATLVSFLTGSAGPGGGSDGSADGAGAGGGSGAGGASRAGVDKGGPGGKGGAGGIGAPGGKGGPGGKGSGSDSGGKLGGGSNYCQEEEPKKPEKVETADSTPCPSKSYKEEVLRCSCP